MYRWLPIELTMMNDLPVMVDPGRGHVGFGNDPRILLYFMDDAAWPTEEGFWVAGAADAEIVVRAGERLHGLMLTIHAPQPNVVRFDAGAGSQTLTLATRRDHEAVSSGDVEAVARRISRSWCRSRPNAGSCRTSSTRPLTTSAFSAST